ncbi:MAG: PadR family transcriptional regulator [Lachnospiraceae bacterium]|nr:PadR family transcriptional regulator [Lachnospiraceae bacterium]
MATIDLIVLGILKKEALSAYDIQKLVEYRNISKWVKISTPSIYKKVIQLEEKGLIKSHIEKEGKMPEKAVYALTDKGEKEFERLMLEISAKSVNIYLDFNAVIVNLDSLSPQDQKTCIENIENNIKQLKAYLVENINEKENMPNIPETAKAVMRQQFLLIQALEDWIATVKG